jgi:uncharacterized protein YjbJ (UPF0337 family)
LHEIEGPPGRRTQRIGRERAARHRKVGSAPPAQIANERQSAIARAVCGVEVFHVRKEAVMGEIIDKVKGKIKQAAGVLAGDKKLEREGKVDEAKGEVKGAVEDVKHVVKEAIKPKGP